GGVRSLWRGNGVNVLKIIPETALRFAFYEETKKVLQKIQNKESHTETTISERFISGAAAGFISQTAIYPLDVLKVRLCLRRTGEFSHWSDAIKRTYKVEACYETLKRLYITKHNNQEPPIYVVLGCGAISSLTGQLVTYPIALIRTRRKGQIVPLPNMDQSKAHPLL
ncbi:unnamed protein product, partial [Adineta steineri]